MQHTVSITSQGQLTIPKSLRNAFGITGAVKAVIERQGDTIIVRPKKDFWALEGSLKSSVVLSDQELKDARKKFETDWARE